ncbi:MAG: hypothetical protein JWN11_629, partial [Hyphomicrobiales bacterium]|nr:hypothetical protein [Hyphomicrobiales bacterium]
MNKPAPKEPSMDEILSSIRQIIADDDATAAPRKAAMPTPANLRPAPIIPPSSLPPAGASAEETPADTPLTWDALSDVAGEAEDAPFALSAAQIVGESEAETDDSEPLTSFAAYVGDTDTGMEDEPMAGAALVDPDDIAFEPERPTEPESEPMFQQKIEAELPAPPSFVASRPMPSAAQAAPMPDPMLSTDITSQLIEPATDAAVRHTFSKLNNIGFSNQGQT